MFLGSFPLSVSLSASLQKRYHRKQRQNRERESARDIQRERTHCPNILSLSRFLSFIRRQHSQNITRDIDADGDEAHREENEHERGETEKEAETKNFFLSLNCALHKSLLRLSFFFRVLMSFPNVELNQRSDIRSSSLRLEHHHMPFQ